MERVVIKIEVNVDDKQLDALLAKLGALESQAKLTGNSFDGLHKNTTKLNDSVDQNSKSMSRMSGAMKKGEKDGNMLSKMVKSLGKALTGVAKFALKAFAINLALGIASIGAIGVAFKLGQLAIRGYRASLNVLAAGAAAVATALSVAAAAQREYNAAMQSTKYGGMQNAMAQLRNINSNTQLAVLGAESLNAAFAGISEKSRMSGGMNKALTALGDFAVASGKADKSMGAAGKFLGELASSGKLTKQIADMAADVGPQFQRAVTEWRKKNGDATAQEFLKALNAGELSKEVAGSLDAVNQTFMGSFKRNFQLIKEQFADMGQPLLPHFTEALNKIARTLRIALLRIQANMQMFARGSMVDSLVGVFEKLSNWMVKAFNEDLPKAIGMIDRMRDRMSGLGDTFKKISDALKPIREAGKVLWQAFGPLVKSVFTEFGGGVKDLSELFIKNKSGLMDFGDSLKNLLESIGNLFGEIKKTVVQALPTLSKLVNVLAQLVNLITAVVGGFNSLGEGGSVGMLALLAFGGAAKAGAGGKGGKGGKGSRFGFLPGGGGGAAGAGSWASRAGTAGGGIGTLAAIAAPLAGAYLGNEGSRSGFGSAGMLVGGALALGSMGKLPGYGKIMGRGGAYRLPTGVAGPTKAIPAQSSMAGALSYAAPLAGGAIAGGFTSDFALNRFGKNTGSTALSVGGTLSGAAGGAIAGAAIGSVIPVVGTAIGALLGGVGGAIVGFMNAGKMKKQARKQAETFVSNYDEAIGKMLESGDYLGAQNLLKQMKAQSSQAASGSKQTDAFTKKYKELEKQLDGKVQPAVELYNKTLGDLSDNLGVGKDKIESMAKTLGVNLVGNVDAVKAALLGLSPDQLNLEGMRNMFFQAMTDTFNKPIQIQEMQQAISAEDIRLRQIIDESGANAITGADIGQYLQTALGYETQFTGNPFKAFSNMYKKLGFEGGTMYQPSGIFAGQGKTLAPQFLGALKGSLGSFVSSGGLKSAAEGLSTAGIEQLGMKGSQGEIQKKLEALYEKASTGSALDMTTFLNTMQMLSGAGVGTNIADTEAAITKILGAGRVDQLKQDPLISAMDGLQGSINELNTTIKFATPTNAGLGGIAGPSGAPGPVSPTGTTGATGPAGPSRTTHSTVAIPSPRPAGGAVSTSNDVVNINIAPQPNASPFDIAQMVAKVIADRDRNKKERK